LSAVSTYGSGAARRARAGVRNPGRDSREELMAYYPGGFPRWTIGGGASVRVGSDQLCGSGGAGRAGLTRAARFRHSLMEKPMRIRTCSLAVVALLLGLMPEPRARYERAHPNSTGPERWSRSVPLGTWARRGACSGRGDRDGHVRQEPAGPRHHPHEFAEYPATATTPASRHDDLMIIHATAARAYARTTTTTRDTSFAMPSRRPGQGRHLPERHRRRRAEVPSDLQAVADGLCAGRLP